LDEFLEKFPYKVGDKVIVWKYCLEGRSEIEESEIKSMRWDCGSCEVAYRMKDITGEFYKKDIKGKVDDKVNESEVNKEIVMNENKPLFKPGDVVKLKGCTDKNLYWIVMDVIKDGYIFDDGKKYLFDVQHNYEKSNRKVINLQPEKIAYLSINNEKYADQIEIDLGDNYEYKFGMNKLYIVKKKPTYPKTYAECCKVIGYGGIIGFAGLDDEEENLYGKFIALKRCRDAYWKIAGEQMGLGKPWKPDFTNNDEVRYGIYTIANKVEKDFCGVGDVNTILTFPTEEMRDAFYGNFKEIIEQCKELL
jgi:hypothetical protein